MSKTSKHTKLQKYYRKHFPLTHIYQMFHYTNDYCKFSHREFSFVVKENIYIRYKSFENHVKLKEYLIENVPDKIDLGAFYNHEPNNRKKLQDQNFSALSKELVLDIDLTDYDEVRSCCKEDNVCLICWKLIVCAMKIIDVTLREDFGFKKMLWVFSGRRGIHLWVCDDLALTLSNEQRKAILGYIEVVKGGAYQIKKVNQVGWKRMHPRMKQIYKEHVEKYFEEITINEMDIFNMETGKEYLKNIPIQSNEAKEKITKIINMSCSSKEKLDEIKELISDMENKPDCHTLEVYLRDFKFQCVYPRLDTNVSIQMHHLLKMPFCVHQKTNKICVPIDLENAELFNPNNVPTLEDLTEDNNDVENEKIKMFKDCVKIFNKFINTKSISKPEEHKIESKLENKDTIKLDY